MLLLASTSDKIRLTLSAAITVDVHASWSDLLAGAVTPGRTNTALSSSGTSDIVGSPAASTFRTVKTLTIRNTHASSSVDVTLIHTDGTTAIGLQKCTLAAGETLHYHEAAGFFYTDALGRAKVVQYANIGTPSGSSINVVLLGSDVTNSNGTANTIADVTGLSFSVLNGKMYYFEFNIVYTAAATTTGSRWSINGPATTYLNFTSEYSLTTTTTTRNPGFQSYDTPAASSASSAATGNNWAFINGVIQPSADGTLIARFASEVSSSAIVAKAGSFVRYIQVN